MISEKLSEKLKIALFCLLDRQEVTSGMEFGKIVVADEPEGMHYNYLAPFRCHGRLGEGLLLSARQGRYYLEVSDGWGVQGTLLYALRADILLEFPKPLSVEEMEALLSSPVGKKGLFANLSEKSKKERLEKVLAVLKAERDAKDGKAGG